MFHSPVTGREMLHACQDMVGHPDWRPGFVELWDLSNVEVDASPYEIDELVVSAHKLRDRIGKNRVAFVTRRETVDALLRLFEVFTLDLGRTYRTFRTREEAAAWLDVPLAVVRT